MLGDTEMTCVLQQNDSIDVPKSTHGGRVEVKAESSHGCEPTPKRTHQYGGITVLQGSLKKPLNIPKRNDVGKSKAVYKYGNYSRYYGYRTAKDFHDVRLDVFTEHKDLFAGKEILDIGCNVGLLTMSIAKDYSIKHITGLDIDKSLINQAKKFIQLQRRDFNRSEETGFPFNLTFVEGNYVVRDPTLLEWIHLNFGDTGVKLAFKRMFKQLKTGGKLILEPQPWDSYKRRKKLTPEIAEIFKTITFHPKDFTEYLLSDAVGFCEMYELERPLHDVKGFRRPLQVFVKK